VAFEIREEQREQAVWVLEDRETRSRAEVCPHLGFNCFRWSANGRELLYADAQFLQGSPPTRSGIPILFPFPNRIRAGRFTWEGRTYQLPLNDPAQKNAIHGFAVRRPWRLVGRGVDRSSAWIQGEFHGSMDAPDCTPLWPTDYRIRVTHRLTLASLRTEAVVDNPGRGILPFGLGYHHYFAADEGSQVQAPAQSYWELQETLPTGERLAIDDPRDLNRPAPLCGRTFDDVLTTLPGSVSGSLCFRGVAHGQAGRVEMWTSIRFRELVVFTPPHRRAVCLEPYTCVTDAINLQQTGIDAGLLLLQPGQEWAGIVELRHTP
jgi:aldose 1-epimerase